MREFARGFALAFRGLALIGAPRVRRYVAVPLTINTVLFGAALYYLFAWLDDLMTWWLPSGLSWLEWLLWPLFAVTALIITFYTFTVVANFIGAPFNGYLAAAVECHLGFTDAPPDHAPGPRGLLGEALRALADELRKLAYFILWAVPLLVLFLVPGINLAAPAVWLLFTAWMLAVEYSDPTLANHGLAFKTQRTALARHRGASLGFGVGITLMTLVPGLNFLVMPAGVAGATALWADAVRQDASRGQSPS